LHWVKWEGSDWAIWMGGSSSDEEHPSAPMKACEKWCCGLICSGGCSSSATRTVEATSRRQAVRGSLVGAGRLNRLLAVGAIGGTLLAGEVRLSLWSESHFFPEFLVCTSVVLQRVIETSFVSACLRLSASHLSLRALLAPPRVDFLRARK
jgi:hypothetical protein